jgi:hypothetical protein
LGCGENEAEERKISALASFIRAFSSIPRSARGASDRLPEPLGGWRFMTLEEAWPCIARRRSALEGRFEAWMPAEIRDNELYISA